MRDLCIYYFRSPYVHFGDQGRGARIITHRNYYCIIDLRAVKEAVEAGKIHRKRYENYLSMYRELQERKKY